MADDNDKETGLVSSDGDADAAISARFSGAVAKIGGPSKTARLLGVSRNTVADWASGKTKLPFAAAADAAELAQLSLDWLANGRGQRRQLRRIDVVGDLMASMDAPSTPSDPPDDFVQIRPLSVQASAGTGRETLPADPDLEPQVAFRLTWLRSLGVIPENAEFAEAKGDSMDPTIKDGDLMLIDRGFGRVAGGRIYVFVYKGLVSVKRVQMLALGGVQLISDNQHYPNEIVVADEMDRLSIQGRVVWYGRVL